MLKKHLNILFKILCFLGKRLAFVATGLGVITIVTILTIVIIQNIPEWLSDGEFSFQDYETNEQVKVQARLYELHPVGSDVKPLLRTLKEAGAIVRYKEENYIDYRYQKLDWSIWNYVWDIYIKYDDKKKIISIKAVCSAKVP